MFDFEKEDARDELELAEVTDDAENISDEKQDFRSPGEIIEEWVQTLMLLAERQSTVSSKVLRLLVLSLSLENEGLAQRSLEQLLDFLEAGSIAEVVVTTVMGTLLPQLTDSMIPLRSRDLLLQALHTLAEEGDGIKEAMRPLAPTLAGWLNENDPSEAVLGVVASACKDTKTSLELRDEGLPRRVIALLQSRDTKGWATALCEHLRPVSSAYARTL